MVGNRDIRLFAFGRCVK